MGERWTRTSSATQTGDGRSNVLLQMSGFGLSIGGDVMFDPVDAFVPAHLPAPGPFLVDHDVLSGTEHAAFHATTADCFEQRGVYDATFGYNLERLNRDPRHPDAGFRYARETVESDEDAGSRTTGDRDAVDRNAGERDIGDRDAGERTVLRAEFTPTTPFCPQSRSLTVGAFRAWNGLADRHEFDLVKVRVSPMHNDAMAINGELQRRENAAGEEQETS